MTFWAWLFAGLFIGSVIQSVMYRQRNGRFVKNLEAQVATIEKAFGEHRVHYNAVYAQKDALFAFVGEFVFQDSVDDLLQRYAENLDFSCRRSVAIQQDKLEDPDEVQNVLTTFANEVAAAKKKFWDLVGILEKANQALGGIRQFRVPKSYKELLKNPVI